MSVSPPPARAVGGGWGGFGVGGGGGGGFWLISFLSGAGESCNLHRLLELPNRYVYSTQ